MSKLKREIKVEEKMIIINRESKRSIKGLWN